MLMATMLARMPDLRSRVQAEHVPDHAGRCRDCGDAPWPCELYQIATEAEHLGTGRAPRRPTAGAPFRNPFPAAPRREPPAPRDPRGDSRGWR